MKNLYLLPTKKPSKLVKIYNDVNRETFTLKLNVEVNDSFKEYVNVYITSDEEIKDVRPHKGKWHLEKENILNKFPDYLTDLSECKLVIMTTDDDLINDGVQAIDDEFLEWVVNNPSCEFVEIKWVKTPDGIFYHQDNVPYGCYKIITPKEESTFYTKKCKCMIFEPNCFTGMCKNCGGILKEETKPKTMLESLQEYFKNTSKEKVLEDWNEFQHLDEEGITVKEFLENQKQETLEEAAEKYSENWEEITGLDYENTVPSEVNKLDFINGAKMQMNKQDEFTLGFLHWYNTSQECETYLRRNYPKNITMNGEHYKKVLQINKELLEMYKNTLPR